MKCQKFQKKTSKNKRGSECTESQFIVYSFDRGKTLFAFHQKEVDVAWKKKSSTLKKKFLKMQKKLQNLEREEIARFRMQSKW